jgi:hypothetical protein
MLHVINLLIRLCSYHRPGHLVDPACARDIRKAIKITTVMGIRFLLLQEPYHFVYILSRNVYDAGPKDPPAV